MEAVGLKIIINGEPNEVDDTDSAIAIVQKHHDEIIKRERYERMMAAREADTLAKRRTEERRYKFIKIREMAISAVLVAVSIVAIMTMILLWG